MKIKNIGKWTVCALVALPLLACSSSERVEDKMMVDDGAVLISGDLTYEKAMEALAPLMTKNDVAVMKIIERLPTDKIVFTKRFIAVSSLSITFVHRIRCGLTARVRVSCTTLSGWRHSRPTWS